ncbi:hypothetical protein HY383_01195 [Candidatus Daviesbacteria bacterium]|nr:hypothetical protein [Candidatus Daviesbacteria bacterium]
MSFLDKVTAFLPIGKKEQELEYFFAVSIGVEYLGAALWTIEGKQLKILNIASENYSSNDEIAPIVDKLLDQVVGLKEIEPQKILFGVPSSWLSDDNLKDEYLKLLRSLVKELELTPMAYVAEAQALIHFLENQEGIPPTAILVGFEKVHLIVTVVRAGKLDGVKVIKRGENSGADIEKALLTFTDVETLPSKILIYGSAASDLKSQLSSFPWMSKLSFLHLPKIDHLEEDLEIKSICLAGGSEIKGDILYTDHSLNKKQDKVNILNEDEGKEIKQEDVRVSNIDSVAQSEDNFGFVTGDITKENIIPDTSYNVSEIEDFGSEVSKSQQALEKGNFEKNVEQPELSAETRHRQRINFKKFLPQKFITLVLVGIVGVGVVIASLYLFILKADIKVYVEPRVLEKDAQVVADPTVKTINEDEKIIPGQIVEIEVSGVAKESASGKKQIGDPAKGTIILYNKTFSSQALSKGTQINGPGGVKFTLDTSATIASASASDSGISFGKENKSVTATVIGADGNLPSGSDFAIAGFSADKLTAKSEGNFSGGTSKDVTVVSSEDQQRLLAKLSSDLRQQAQQKLQEKYPDKKILMEALSENIVKKSYSKNINDQASEFSLNMTVKFKGTAFDDADLRTIVSKLVNLQVPDGFALDISATETQADVAKLEKDGRLIFLARFKAKMLPKIDTDKIKDQFKFKTIAQVSEALKGMDNILGSEIKLTPNLPSVLGRLPVTSKNITVEVGLK